ncbi:hypothetical protein FDP41_009748 [Naegleria fowleri]|uniref:TRAF-type domain-containing protein n=1 Tax=Naegleria fowleri TaxID=5763 RepID=A0A6A5BAD1_NAEFO|nr:uncharacterized protein FDP41_009748 [Naegleria fowleri]KAF0972052.1 hypothetical protein FDP41_009748 [Naegleria fowleri]
MLRDLNDDSSFLHNRFVEKLADDSEVDCPNMCSQGKVKRGNLKEHLEKFCENIIRPCAMKKFGCNFEGNFNQLQNHKNECAYIKLAGVLESYENTITDLRRKCANAQQGEEFKMKISTLEQTNELLRLENDELKEKVRKLQKQAQHSSTQQSSSSQNNNANTSTYQDRSNHQRQNNSYSNTNNYNNQNNYHNNNYYNSHHQHTNHHPHTQPSSHAYTNTNNFSHNQNRSNTSDDHYHKSGDKHNRRSSNKDNCKQQ